MIAPNGEARLDEALALAIANKGGRPVLAKPVTASELETAIRAVAADAPDLLPHVRAAPEYTRLALTDNALAFILPAVMPSTVILHLRERGAGA